MRKKALRSAHRRGAALSTTLQEVTENSEIKELYFTSPVTFSSMVRASKAPRLQENLGKGQYQYGKGQQPFGKGKGKNKEWRKGRKKVTNKLGNKVGQNLETMEQGNKGTKEQRNKETKKQR